MGSLCSGVAHLGEREKWGRQFSPCLGPEQLGPIRKPTFSCCVISGVVGHPYMSLATLLNQLRKSWQSPCWGLNLGCGASGNHQRVWGVTKWLDLQQQGPSRARGVGKVPHPQHLGHRRLQCHWEEHARLLCSFVLTKGDDQGDGVCAILASWSLPVAVCPGAVTTLSGSLEPSPYLFSPA